MIYFSYSCLQLRHLSVAWACQPNRGPVAGLSHVACLTCSRLHLHPLRPAVMRLAVMHMTVIHIAMIRLAAVRLAVLRLAVMRLAVIRLAVIHLAVIRLAVKRLAVKRLAVIYLARMCPRGHSYPLRDTSRPTARHTPVTVERGWKMGHVRPIIALSPTARKLKETAPKIRRVCSPLHGRFSFSWNLALPVGSGYLEPKMLFCECDRICVVHEGEKQRTGARVL
ncbi:hypothetical protein PMIN01_11655 [Paraphaeosphaeria minitans]|uniref:Uncharacterized protein n=1 Tax=Paraphaeosphaeria minitans TaxID=565426 RepID=A0A9P6G8Y0_9PLEO|nr:hypothetical protein PMIN01_11655 [Paraphaeosphaeria minitans]